MIIDGFLLLDGTFSATAGLSGSNQFSSDTSTVSTNVLDMINARDMGMAPGGLAPLTVDLTVMTAFTGGTSVTFAIQGSTDNVTYTTYEQSAAIGVASLPAQARVRLPLPPVNPDSVSAPRYYRLKYTTVGNVTAGSVVAFLGSDSQVRYYAPGVVVSN